MQSSVVLQPIDRFEQRWANALLFVGELKMTKISTRQAGGGRVRYIYLWNVEKHVFGAVFFRDKRHATCCTLKT